jgi:uncharacterized protein (DUF2147 family)
MSLFLKRVAAVFTAVVISSSAVWAADPGPEGVWEAKDGESRYAVAFCGGGQALCAHVSWVKPEAINDRNRVLLDVPLFENLPPSGRNRWRGEIHLLGHTLRGTVKLIAADRLEVTGCVFLVICESTVLKRVPEEG